MVPGRCIASWSTRDVPASVQSIPALVERYAARLTDEYLAWTHELGAFAVRGRDVRARLAVAPNLSFWWMTLLAEKEPLRSPGIYRVFKLRALELLYRETGSRGVTYVGSDVVLSDILKRWCARIAVPYAYARPAARVGRHVEERPSRPSERFPYLLQAVWHLVRTWCGRVRHVRRSSAAPADNGG